MILVETFNNKADALKLIDVLDRNNIPYIQKSEDAGEKYGSFIFSSGVQVFIS